MRDIIEGNRKSSNSEVYPNSLFRIFASNLASTCKIFADTLIG